MVTDRRRYEAGSDAGNLAQLLAAIRRAARAGIQLVQIRERELTDRMLLAFVKDAIAAVRDTPARVLVNERTDIAVAAGAAGVHLRSTSASAARVRATAPDEFLVGRSIHSREEAESAVREGGCDYLLFGTIYQSTSKPDVHPAAGVDALRTVCAASPLPVLAIGGITLGRAAEVARAGASGIAAISLFAHGSEQVLRQTADGIRNAFALARST